MDSRGEVQKRLKTLNPAQFEEVLFRLRIDPAIIPSPFAEQSLRAIRVIQRLEQEPEGLECLNQILDEPAISIIGEQYSGHEIEAQVKRIINDYTQQPLEGREEEKRQLDDFVLNNSKGVLLVTGAAGFGKSALLSHWQQTKQDDYFIAYHCFSYRYQKTRSVSEAYRHLLKQLYLYYNIRNGQFPTDENQMRELLVGMLRKPVSPEGKRLVIVLDGLDEASETFEPFFPLLPDGVFVIASARAEEEEKPTYLRNWIDDADQRLCLKRLSREAIPKWLGEIRELAIYAKDDQFVNRLDEITSGFPLYLRYLIDELRQVATQNQDVREVLAQTPTGFEEYVEQQLNGLDELKLPEQTLQLFALLAVAKGVLEKEDIKTLTQMRDRDLRQLGKYWQVTRWMQITEGKFYAFAHPLLAKTFGNQLGDEAEDALQDLIGYCGKWQEHQSAYALQYYAEHLQEGKRWQELYELAHHQDYVTAQRQQLPEQPDLPLKTVQRALWSKAETDDGAGMAEFLLLHAGRVIQITTQESPLEALRVGNITTAWALVEQFDIERCILWYLLLAWELVKDATQDKGKMEQARETLERLQQKNLPRFSKVWMEDCAVYLLTPLLTATKGTFIALSRLILDDQRLRNLCQNLVEGSDFTTALNIVKQMQDSRYKAEALIEIAKAQPTAENFRAAIDTAKDIDHSYDKAWALIEIAKAQLTAENFRAAIDTAKDIENSTYKAWALIEIAIAQPTAENFRAAIDTAKDIEDSYDKALAFREIAKAQAQAENFRAAIDTAKDIQDSSYKAEALIEIAKAQPTVENFRAAIDTAKDIEYSYSKARALLKIAKAQPTAENFRAAIDTAKDIQDSYYKAEALMEIATAQPTAENFRAAIDTAKDIDHSYFKARALIEIAKAQVKAKRIEQALLTAEKILINRNEHLPDIAAAFVETGDKEHFKHLLIPCAYYLDAAYQMCGHLAKLYPTQVTDIAKVINNFTLNSP
ncbi:MAG: AAA family ATPase [Coleofasciculus sp. A1-SPW-01]|uniref:AAA family ATPase n=1 Tax=Coleofasciculus sp. A1-SPW-01 TaxID=3070819 RepID=UPI003303C780